VREVLLLHSFFFQKMPEDERPIAISDIPIHIGRTLAIIKPDAIDKRDEIEEIIQQHGFSILQVRCPVFGQCLS
jgi:hypothetical protein